MNEEMLENLYSLLIKRFERDEKEQKHIQTKKVLTLVGKGLVFASLLFAPNLRKVKEIKDFLNLEESREYFKYLKYYNLTDLKKSLRRLQKQKVIQVLEKKGKQVVVLTEKGKSRVLKYAIDELNINKTKNWDRKWRLVIYDVPKGKNKIRDILRSTLDRLGFLKLQDSVYIIPYACEEEIEFLRVYYGLNDEIKMLTISKIEGDLLYREYFALQE